jgi:hypothetical protein
MLRRGNVTDFDKWPQNGGALWNSLSYRTCDSGFPSGKVHFLGGNDDEFVRVPTFVALDCEIGKHLPFFYGLWIARALRAAQKITMPDALSRVAARIGAMLRGKGTTRKNGDKVDARALYIVPWLEPGVPHYVDQRPSPQRDIRILESGWADARRDTRGAKTIGRSPAFKPKPHAKGPKGTALLPARGGFAVYVDVDDAIRQFGDVPWLGILYLDRLRIRPVGPVLGRLLYTHALAPSEETTLTQRSWTKREVLFEDVHDREQEQSLEFDTTWSTSFVSQLTEQWNAKLSSDLTSKLGGTEPTSGITAEVGSRVGAEQGFLRTRNTQSTLNRSLTQKASAKAKEQHKTTFKVTTETGAEFTSKRILRNTNPDRSLHLHFHKVLQKFHVSLERPDALLCLRFCVPDPAATMRKVVLAELQKLDPQIDPTEGPQPGAADWGAEFEITQYASGNWEIGDETNYMTIPLEIPTNYALSTYEGPSFVRARNEDGATKYEGDEDEFRRDGGYLGFTRVPPAGATGAIEFEVGVTYPEPSWWVNGTDIGEVTYRIKVGAVPSDQYTEDFRKTRESWENEQRELIKASFSLDRLKAIASKKSLLKEHVLGVAMEKFFLPGYFASGAEPPCRKVEQITDWFQWEEVEAAMLPWWLTPKGRDNRAQLDRFVGTLPADVIQTIETWDFLASPLAIVYLPIKKGFEEEAIAALLNISRSDKEWKLASQCVDSFRGFAAGKFPSNARSLSDDQTIDAPTVALGTPLGSDSWDNAWETARQRFIVLDEWAEIFPTDGIHIEAVLGACDGTSELRRAQLLAEVREREAGAAAQEPAPTPTEDDGEPE